MLYFLLIASRRVRLGYIADASMPSALLPPSDAVPAGAVLHAVNERPGCCQAVFAELIPLVSAMYPHVLLPSARLAAMASSEARRGVRGRAALRRLTDGMAVLPPLAAAQESLAAVAMDDDGDADVRSDVALLGAGAPSVAATLAALDRLAAVPAARLAPHAAALLRGMLSLVRGVCSRGVV